MITKLNLSSNPFRNRRLPYILAAMMILFAFGGGVYGIAQYQTASKANLTGNASIAALKTEISELKAKGENVQESLSPEQKRLMVAGHRLVATKEFGWSRLLFDIEKVLPADVSASRVRVQDIFKENGAVSAELEFSVLSTNYTSVLSMIDRMNNSGVFRASLRGQDLQEGDRFTYSEYTLVLTYRPGAGFPAAPTADVASAVREGGGSDDQ